MARSQIPDPRSQIPVVLYTDGGARGNPGPAAIGGAAFRGERELFRFARRIGERTNNQAEYRALIYGLAELKRLGVRQAECRLDSELIVRQLEGLYRVKQSELKPLWQQATELAESLESIKFVHIMRTDNALADGLVNVALDGEAV